VLEAAAAKYGNTWLQIVTLYCTCTCTLSFCCFCYICQVNAVNSTVVNIMFLLMWVCLSVVIAWSLIKTNGFKPTDFKFDLHVPYNSQDMILTKFSKMWHEEE